ncbi:MAG: hypothetical protein ACR2RV_22795, partial [Verrucomicrobiales bacterium]
MKLDRLTNTFLLAVSLLALALPAAHAAEQTQTLDLEAGWNAVWLEVDPASAIEASAAVEEVFDSPAVTVVARPVVPVGTAEFVSDPQRAFNRAGWVVWYRNPESGENTLFNVDGYQAYLVFVDRDGLPAGDAGVSLEVAGEARFHRPSWSSRRYHFVGFNLLEPVTFGAFFGVEGETGGSHPVQLAFRLGQGGVWEPVTHSDLMRPGEAFWVYSEDKSDFMGPVSVSFDGRVALDFGVGPAITEIDDGAGGTVPVSLRDVRLSNGDATGHPVRLRKIDSGLGGEPDPTDADLRLYEVVPVPGELAYQAGPNGEFEVWDVGEVEAGGITTLKLGAHRDWAEGKARRETLYRIRSGAHFSYLPVVADQQGAPLTTEPGLGDPVTAATYAGLWAGVVVFDSVVPFEPNAQTPTSTKSKTPMRILVHVDSGGKATLIQHVTIMQQEGKQVLVVDDSKISNYQGVETRNGKLVGLRISTVGYDMPRDWSTTAQMDLVAAVAEANSVDPADVTSEMIMNYVDALDQRPPDLDEAYELTWPLDGDFDSGLTTAQPLNLDPFHRSNPFRHAFHPSHV